MWSRVAFVSFCLTSVLLAAATEESPIASTIYGKVSGKIHTTPKGFDVQMFFGIPFAAPPIGDLRFRKPVKPAAWDGVKVAEEFPQQCIQGLLDEMDIFPKAPAGRREDCLYLNVLAPVEKSSDPAGYPVMVWIHGGGFIYGSTYEYGYKGIANNLVQRGVVVVAIQYRLGFFGFLSTGDEVAQGNWGLWDQLEALQWVQDNIANFGGNPGKVTIFGESAGGASTSLLSYLSQDENLFHQVISQSGSGTSFWCNSGGSVPMTNEYLKSLNCDLGESAANVDCLRHKSVEDIQETMKLMWHKLMEGGSGNLFTFGPMIDTDLYTKSISELAKTTPKRPTMLGTMAQEAAIFYKPPPGLESWSLMALKNDSDMTLERFEATLAIYLSEGFLPHSHELAKKIAKFFYVDSAGGHASNFTYLIQQSIQLGSDMMFNVPAYTDLLTKVTNDIDVWAYRFKFVGPKTYPVDFPWKDATHAMDLLYIFDLDFLADMIKMERTAEDYRMTDIVCDLWTNFAKFGNPTPKSTEDIPNWPKFTTANPQVLVIDNRLELSSSFHQAAAALWTDLIPSIEVSVGNRKKAEEKKTDKTEL